MRILSLVLLILLLGHTAEAQTKERLQSFVGRQFFVQDGESDFVMKSVIAGDSSISENPRAVAIILDITLGILGMHRLYLGTDLKVPILYTLTFGGGGILWLADLGLLIFTKDITPYMNNPSVFMWTGNEKKKR
jgi:TM2 domain-containing membrane protein YozV